MATMLEHPDIFHILNTGYGQDDPREFDEYCNEEEYEEDEYYD